MASALECNSRSLDADLLTLVRANAASARVDSRPELAALMDSLGDYIATWLALPRAPHLLHRVASRAVTPDLSRGPASVAPTVSLCMIVRNESANLPRCLASVKDSVDELVVVDTGSTDDTPDVAAAFGTRVWHFEWQDDFAGARNTALEHATGDWILHLDADEELAAGLAALVQPCVAAHRRAAFLVNVRSRNGESDLTQFYDSWQVRLFRNRPDFRYELAVHEQIVYAIKRAGLGVVPSPLEIIHPDTFRTSCRVTVRGFE